MAAAQAGLLARLIAGFVGWFAMRSDAPIVRSPPVSAMPEPAAILPHAEFVRRRGPTNFMLAARLHATARLNPPKSRMSTRRTAPAPGRPARPIATAPKARRQARETRYVWLMAGRTAGRPRPTPASASIVTLRDAERPLSAITSLERAA